MRNGKTSQVVRISSQYIGAPRTYRLRNNERIGNGRHLGPTLQSTCNFTGLFVDPGNFINRLESSMNRRISGAPPNGFRDHNHGDLNGYTKLQSTLHESTCAPAAP